MQKDAALWAYAYKSNAPPEVLRGCFVTEDGRTGFAAIEVFFATDYELCDTKGYVNDENRGKARVRALENCAATASFITAITHLCIIGSSIYDSIVAASDAVYDVLGLCVKEGLGQGKGRPKAVKWAPIDSQGKVGKFSYAASAADAATLMGIPAAVARALRRSARRRWPQPSRPGTGSRTSCRAR